MVLPDFTDNINDDLQDEEELSSELTIRLQIKTDKGQEPMRIDKFLMQKIENASRNKIQKGIEDGMVLVNNQPVKANYKIKAADEILVYDTRVPESTEIIPEKMDLDLVYEDEDLLVVNKPPGMVVHPGSGNYSGTLVNGLAWYLNPSADKSQKIELPRIGLVHRIDKDTSGLLLVAKNELSRQKLSDQFKAHTIHRRYQGLAWGDVTEEEGSIQAHIGRNLRYRKKMDAFPDGEHGKEAITHYKVLERFHYVTLLEFRLETGRTHQIRVHAKLIGHPLFNDTTYGGDRIVKGTVYSKYKQFIDNCFKVMPRQALHAKELGFIHPATGKEMFFNSLLPDDFQALLEKWRLYVSQYS